MARLSSQYDKEVGKVFVIRGDEAYARTTDSRVKVMASDRTDFNNYRVGLLCNVYRDRGESKITLYNGDIVVNQFDWSDNTEQMYIGMNNTHTAIDPDTCLELAWGVPHEIYIRYKGNNQCLPSKSKVLQIYEPLPDEFATNITMTTSKHNNNVTVTVELDINGVATSGTHNTDIEIYLDDEIVETINTGDTNTASTTIENIDVGIHTITAIVVGTDRIHSATTSTEEVIGDKITITQYPQPFIIGANNIILVSVTSFNGDAISGGTVTFNGETYTTNSDGIATIELTDIEDGVYHATYNSLDSDDITIETYTPNIVIRVDNGIVSRDKKDTLYINLSRPLQGMPVTLTKRNRETDAVISEETIYVNETYVRTISGGNYNEYGTGLVTYDVQCYNAQDHVDVDDVIYAYKNKMQWNPNSLHVSEGSVTENVSGLVVQGNTANDFPVIDFVESGILTKSWILSFQVTSNTANLKMDVNGEGEYSSLGIGDKSKVFVEIRCYNRFGIGTVSAYVDGVKKWTKTGNCVPNIALYPKDPNVIRKALFYDMKLVRVNYRS